MTVLWPRAKVVYTLRSLQPRQRMGAPSLLQELQSSKTRNPLKPSEN
jgi:hypothetical protein